GATAVAQTGARIMTLLTAVATGQTSPQPIAATLQQAWTPQQPETIALFNAALILCADHELNVSAFTARCVASAASTPYGVVLAGLAALQGAKHGGHTERAAALLQEAATAADAAAAVLSRLRRGESIPGFGHKLYPDGDPRARLLLQMVEIIAPDAPDLALAQGVATAVLQTIGAHPTIDFGLVTLARVLHLPAQAALTLFALGRVVGWIGHALEQYQLDQIIRPRARYVGAPPAAQNP
ncbi:MAG: citrate synthase, partial [Anaerolinea sp.]|nr:citrate synthase [Anaerolinea sp.]